MERIPSALRDEALERLRRGPSVVGDLEKHNERQRQLWEAYARGEPPRVPVRFGFNPRFVLLDPELNPERVTFKEYTEDPELMLQIQVRFQCWLRHAVPQDAEMGLPQEGWSVGPDFQNYYEGAWLGCEVFWHDDEVPDCAPWLRGERKHEIFRRGTPDLHGGLMAKNLEYYEYFKRRQQEGFEFLGLPLANVGLAMGGTDGPFTVACNLRGATEICLDIYEDPDYVHALLGFITQATIARIQTIRRHLGQPLQTQGWAFADDSIELLSQETYREFVFPYHRQLVETFSNGGPNSIHLCGDASRHFLFLRDELKVMSFDTGFPIDFGAVRRTLGPEVTLYGGPSIQLLLHATPQAVREECRRILQSGVTEGKRFVLREGNNMAPRTPLENIAAVYQAAQEYGRYE